MKEKNRREGERQDGEKERSKRPTNGKIWSLLCITHTNA